MAPFVPTGKHNIHYNFIGNYKPGLPLLVFLHEGLGSIAQWKTFPEKLCEATGLQGLVYDRYGYGASTPLQEERTPSYLEEEAHVHFPAFLEALNVDHPLILIGHSDGGSIALLFASLFPAKVLGVATEAAHVFVEDVTLKGIQEAKHVYSESPKLKKALSRYHGDHTDSTFYGWNSTWLLPAFAYWNIENCLPQVTCPLLIVQGQDDQYGTLAQVNSIVSQSGGEATAYVVPACGHAPHAEQPELVLTAMLSFIESLIA